MTLTHRLLRFLGRDTTITETHTMPVYKYRIIHTNGEESNQVAHGYNLDGAFIRMYNYTKPRVWPALISGYHVSAGNPEIVRVLESIQEIERERIGTVTYKAVIDKADGEVVNKEVTTEYKDE